RNPHRMRAANHRQLARAWPFVEGRPPVVVDWLPWSHTFGGNHNFNLVLRNGGTLYIDSGKPTNELFEISVKNLRNIKTNIHFNVPAGFKLLVASLQVDATLRKQFTEDLRVVFS